MKFLKNSYALSIVSLILLFILIATLVSLDKLTLFDNVMYKTVTTFNLDTFFNIVTEFGGFLVFPIFVTIFFAFTKDYKWSFYLIINAGGMALLNFLLKNIFVRQRPSTISALLEGGFSFPSGHTATSAAFYSLVLYFVFKKCKNKWIKWISVLVLPVVILLIGTSRIYLGVHFASDVLAGLVLGILFTLVEVTVIKKMKNNNKNS